MGHFWPPFLDFRLLNYYLKNGQFPVTFYYHIFNSYQIKSITSGWIRAQVPLFSKQLIGQLYHNHYPRERLFLFWSKCQF